MKTSSKILLSGAIMVFAFIFFSGIYLSSVVAGDNGRNFIFKSVQGNGVISEEHRTVTPFDKIEVSNGIQLYLTQDSSYTLKVVADENAMPHIITEVHNNTLKIYTDQRLRNMSQRDVFVDIAGLRDLEISSGAKATTTEGLQGSELNIDGSSGGQSQLTLQYSSIIANASSGAVLNIDGLADETRLNVSSGANINVSDLKTGLADVNASSGGMVQVLNHPERMRVNASSGGYIAYTGNPEMLSTHLSSGGNLEKR